MMREVLEEGEFDRLVNAKKDDPKDLAVFIAWQFWHTRKAVSAIAGRLDIVEKQSNKNSRFILSIRQWIILVLIAVIGCGGGETAFDALIRFLGWSS